jgi:hypothetical protein
MQSITGLDHVVVVVRDLAESARRWQNLGFTVAPLGRHPPHMGTANHTVMLGDDYIELLGALTPTDNNLKTREFLGRRGEGIERAALTSIDAAASVAELKARGIAAIGPMDFSRPVDLPSGQKSAASFRTFLWPAEEQRAGMRIFGCEHLTRETVWIPQLTRHANTAQRIDRIEILCREPTATAAHMSQLVGRSTEAMADGAFRMRSGPDRADFVFLDRATLERRHAGVPLTNLPAEGCVTLAIGGADLARAKDAVGSRAAIATPDAVKVAPAEANGLILEFRAG